MVLTIYFFTKKTNKMLKFKKDNISLPIDLDPLDPFNLERALAGDPVVTRTGRQVTQITTLNYSEFCVSGIIDGSNRISLWLESGSYFFDGVSELDLFMAKRKKEYKCGYIKIFPLIDKENIGDNIMAITSSVIFDSIQKAEEMGSNLKSNGIIVPIGWEEW